MAKALTREFLIERGECCGNQCSKCPFYIKWTKGSKEVFEVPSSVDCRPSCSIKTMQEGGCMCYMDYKLGLI